MNENRIRVMHSFPTWLPQTQTWMYNQVKYIPKNIEVHIACERTENLDQFWLPNIYCLRDTSFARYIWQKAMRNLHLRYFQVYLTSVIKNTEASLIHSHFGNIGWNNLHYVEETGARHVVTFYGYDVNRLPTQDKRWLSRYRELFQKADLFLCEGPHMAKQLIKLGCREEKVRVQHLGIDIGNIKYQPRSWKPGTPLRVLIAASFREKKGIPYAIEALAKIQNNVSLEITIIGDSGSDRHSLREKQRILDTIENEGLKEKTRLLGYQPYSVLFNEAYKHHVFISPSVTSSDGDVEGGAPVTLIDMMATGMPVISTIHCDIPEVVQYGIENWLVRERDVIGLVEKLLWLIEKAGEWEKITIAGRKHVKSSFNAHEQGRILGEIYKEVICQ